MSVKEKNTYKQGFKTPEDYFPTFEKRLFEKIEQEQLFEKNTGFRVPDAYFDEMEQKTLSKIMNQHIKKSSSKVISLQLVGKIAMAMAASLAIFMCFQWIVQSTQTPSLASIQISSIETYLEDEPIIDNYDMMALLEESKDTFPEELIELSKEDIEEYLLNSADFIELIETESL